MDPVTPPQARPGRPGPAGPGVQHTRAPVPYVRPMAADVVSINRPTAGPARAGLDPDLLANLGRWVALRDGKIVATGTDAHELRSSLGRSEVCDVVLVRLRSPAGA